jgi:hypothetical protein
MGTVVKERMPERQAVDHIYVGLTPEIVRSKSRASRYTLTMNSVTALMASHNIVSPKSRASWKMRSQKEQLAYTATTLSLPNIVLARPSVLCGANSVMTEFMVRSWSRLAALHALQCVLRNGS